MQHPRDQPLLYPFHLVVMSCGGASKWNVSGAISGAAIRMILVEFE